MFIPQIFILKWDSHLPKKMFYLFQWKPFKNDQKMFFYFILKALLVVKIFKFLSWLSGHAEKTAWLELKVNFEIYEATTWLTNHCNKQVAQYFMK